MTLTARWSCYGCDATGEGPGSDREAEKHTKATGHSTCTYEIPADKARNAAGERGEMVGCHQTQTSPDGVLGGPPAEALTLRRRAK